MTNDQPRDPAATSEVARLLRCPFCGDSNPKIYMNAPSSDRTPWPHVVCISCGCGMTSIEAWNRRAAPTAVQAAGDAVAWQDIETAPKDLGFALLGNSDEGWVEQGWWDGEREEWWPLNCHHTDSYGQALHASHWQPLPTPPGIHAEKSPATDPLAGEA